jgi:hypothetical protein
MEAHFSLGGDSFLSITVRKCSTFTLKVAKPSTPHSPPRLWGYVVALPRAFLSTFSFNSLPLAPFSGLPRTFRVVVFDEVSYALVFVDFSCSLIHVPQSATSTTNSNQVSFRYIIFSGEYRILPMRYLGRIDLSFQISERGRG